MTSAGSLSEICGTCKRMTSTLAGLQDLTSDAGYRHLNFVEVKKSARDGCKLCEILENCHRQDVTKKPTEYHERVYLRIFSHLITFAAYYKAARELQQAMAERGLHPFDREPLRRLVSVPWDDALYGNSWKSPGLRHSGMPPLQPIQSLACYTSSDNPAAAYLSLAATKLTFRSKTITDRILQQLRDCLAHHSQCPKIPSRAIPRRILNVDPESGADTIRLTSSHLDGGKYLALSYVWGGIPTLLTTRSSLASHERGIPVSDLPKTMRDAVQVTRDLGFRYLWVDALCIVQDDFAEMNLEITKMGEIYRHATVTISAANVYNVLESFLADRKIPNSCTVPYLLPDGTFGTLYLRIMSQYFEYMPILTRAWTLQESTLSARTLWYCDFDIRWTCAEDDQPAILFEPEGKGFALNCGPLHYPPPVMKEQQLTSEAWFFEKADYWAKMVTNYTRRNLTYERDRLPALAGIASELEKAWQDEYINGLWIQCLVSNLSWYRFQQPTSMRHTGRADFLSCHVPDKYESPSWSWAGHSGCIRFGWHMNDDDEELKEVNLPAKLIGYQTDVEDPDSRLTRLWKGSLMLDTHCFDENQRLQSQRVTRVKYQFWWDHCDCACKVFPYDGFAYAMLGSDPWQAYGLVLARVHGETYRRVGGFRMFVELYPLGDRWPVASKRTVTII